MHTYMKLLGIVGILGIMVVSNGCMSYMSYQSSADQIKKERILASGNQVAMKAIQNGVDADVAIRAIPVGDGAGIGIDVANLDALTKNPLRQLGAALLDAATIYGVFLGVEEIQNHNDSEDSKPVTPQITSTSAGGDINTVNITGEGNTINIGNTSTEDNSQNIPPTTP